MDRIALNWILKNSISGFGSHSSSSSDFCEHGKKPLDPVKAGELLDQPGN
jgi:hypothetical protein